MNTLKTLKTSKKIGFVLVTLMFAMSSFGSVGAAPETDAVRLKGF